MKDANKYLNKHLPRSTRNRLVKALKNRRLNRDLVNLACDWRPDDFCYIFPILREMLVSIRQCNNDAPILQDQKAAIIKSLDTSIECLDKLISCEFGTDDLSITDRDVEKQCRDKLFNTIRDNIMTWWC